MKKKQLKIIKNIYLFLILDDSIERNIIFILKNEVIDFILAFLSQFFDS